MQNKHTTKHRSHEVVAKQLEHILNLEGVWVGERGSGFECSSELSLILEFIELVMHFLIRHLHCIWLPLCCESAVSEQVEDADSVCRNQLLCLGQLRILMF